MPDDEQVLEAEILTFPNSGERRLRMALRNLDAALEEQRQAVAAFRAELAQLGSAMQSLGESTLGLQDRLFEVAEDNALAHQAALRLQQTAAAMDHVTCDA